MSSAASPGRTPVCRARFRAVTAWAWKAAPVTSQFSNRLGGVAMGKAREDTRPSADEALAHLSRGNKRFVRGKPRGAAFRHETLADLAKAQRPYATILGCSDSRV